MYIANEFARVINVYTVANYTPNASINIHMHHTDTFIEESMVPDKEDAVQSHVSDTSTLPSGLLFTLRGPRHPSYRSMRCLSSEM